MCSEKILIINNDTNTQNAYEALLKPCGYDICLIFIKIFQTANNSAKSLTRIFN